MCGRFALYVSEEEIVSHFRLRGGFSMRPRYNLAPSQIIPIICKWGGQIEFSRWGFIPPWVKNKENTPLGHINVRFETIAEKPTFKAAYRSQRCLIPASGYFEWRTFKEKKQPYYICIKGKPLIAFAGIWSYWTTPKGEKLQTCAIITKEAPEPLRGYHDRIPFIISPDKYALWLGNSGGLDKESVDFGFVEEDLRVHAVSSRMNNSRFEGKECILPLSSLLA